MSVVQEVSKKHHSFMEKVFCCRAETMEDFEEYETLLQWCEDRCSMMESGEATF